VLLDMNMPGIGGIETCGLIRSGSDIAIIMLTVSSSEKTSGSTGRRCRRLCDKAFSMPELLARIRATLRRLPQAPDDSGLRQLALEGVAIDLSSRQ